MILSWYQWKYYCSSWGLTGKPRPQKRIPADHAFEVLLGVEDGQSLQSFFGHELDGVIDGSLFPDGDQIGFHDIGGITVLNLFQKFLVALPDFEKWNLADQVIPKSRPVVRKFTQ